MSEIVRLNKQMFEDLAKRWKEGRYDLLSDGCLWQGVRFVRSNTGQNCGLSELALGYIETSYIQNKSDYEGTARLRDDCRGCGTTYRSENLLICIGCSTERCGGCASGFERNEYGDPMCGCGGVFV